MRRWSLCLIGSLCLAACGTDDDDLRAWMDGARRRHHAVPLTVTPAKAAALLRFEPGGRSDPFSQALLSVADAMAPVGGLQPDLQRMREPLEAYPLANLRLVGSMRRKGDVIALIEVDQHVHSVRIGSHIGQDFGKVISIGDKTIDIEELVPDSNGSWISRRAQLALQETR